MIIYSLTVNLANLHYNSFLDLISGIFTFSEKLFRRKIMKKIGVLLLIALLAFGCASNSRKVSRVAVDSQIDLSGRWNDQDSRLVAQQIIKDIISANWLMNFQMDNSDKPTVIVGKVSNLSDEHIDKNTFVKDIERELINSGRVRFVASSNERNQIREERMEQQQFSSEETAKRLGAETGADFVLIGSIKTITDASGGTKVKFYQIDMELVNVETNEKVWMGNKKIKKVIERSKAKW